MATFQLASMSSEAGTRHSNSVPSIGGFSTTLLLMTLHSLTTHLTPSQTPLVLFLLPASLHLFQSPMRHLAQCFLLCRVSPNLWPTEASGLHAEPRKDDTVLIYLHLASWELTGNPRRGPSFFENPAPAQSLAQSPCSGNPV